MKYAILAGETGDTSTKTYSSPTRGSCLLRTEYSVRNTLNVKLNEKRTNNFSAYSKR